MIPDSLTALQSLLIDIAVCYQRTLISPQLWAAVHEVKDLRRVQKLPEPAQELDALVVTTLTVHQHQQRTRAGWNGGLPKTCSEQGMMKKDNGGMERREKEWE